MRERSKNLRSRAPASQARKRSLPRARWTRLLSLLLSLATADASEQESRRECTYMRSRVSTSAMHDRTPGWPRREKRGKLREYKLTPSSSFSRSLPTPRTYMVYVCICRRIYTYSERTSKLDSQTSAPSLSSSLSRSRLSFLLDCVQRAARQ